MKVGFIAPHSIAAVNGGVRTQANQTAKQLNTLGVDVTLISPWDAISELDIDVFHVFSSSIENIGIVSRLKELNKKIVLSPVLFSNRSAGNIKKLLKVEKKLVSVSAGIRSEFAMKSEICSKADLLLPNTANEADLISEAFEIPESKIAVIPNGVEKRFSESDSTLFKEKYGLVDFVLFVGQASAPRKNVLNLIKSFEGLSNDLVIIGDFTNSEYSRKCLSIAEKNENIHLINSLDHDSPLLSSAYAACKVFVLPSEFETPGISAMEAALAGANIVITEIGGTKEYFTENTEYVSPVSNRSIKNGIQRALDKPRSNDLKNHILEKYTWENVAKLTFEQYKKVLG